MSQDPEAIRRLTRSYRFLRGYEGVPFALWVIANHLLDRPRDVYSLLAFLLTAGVALAATLAIKRYYDRRFGVVATASGNGWRIVAIGSVVFFGLQLASNGFGLPVQLGFLVIGVALAIYALRRFELEWQKLILAAFLIVISVWPPIIVPWEANELWHDVFAIGFATAVIAMSILDHRALVKMLGRARVPEMNGAH